MIGLILPILCHHHPGQSVHQEQKAGHHPEVHLAPLPHLQHLLTPKRATLTFTYPYIHRTPADITDEMIIQIIFGHLSWVCPQGRRLGRGKGESDGLSVQSARPGKQGEMQPRNDRSAFS